MFIEIHFKDKEARTARITKFAIYPKSMAATVVGEEKAKELELPMEFEFVFFNADSEILEIIPLSKLNDDIKSIILSEIGAK